MIFSRGALFYKYIRVCLKYLIHDCRPRPVIINPNEPKYLFIFSVNKCGGNYNAINDPYAPACVPDNVNNMNVKVFNLMSKVNETRFLVQRESCDCKCT